MPHIESYGKNINYPEGWVGLSEQEVRSLAKEAERLREQGKIIESGTPMAFAVAWDLSHPAAEEDAGDALESPEQ